MDTDIPVYMPTGAPVIVAATPVKPSAVPGAVAVAQAAPRPGLTKGRSSRVALPTQQSYKLQSNEIATLRQQGFTTGLAHAMTQNNASFALRLWVVDNSGSMNKSDGHRIVTTSKNHNVRLVPCTRWTELQQTVDYHVQMAGLLQAPTVFRLLNDPGRAAGEQQFSICENGPAQLDSDIARAKQTMLNASPGGVTPLSDHLKEIRQNVVELLPTLQRNGAKVAIILATDGLPTNSRGVCDTYTKNEFVESLRSLEGLPVWVVVRLCTDEEDVVEYYNELDNQLELSLEVLDDFTEEAKEVYGENKWLNYALPLHRCREMGYYSRLFDLLDERPLTVDEVQDFLRLLLGDAVMDYDPQGDWKGFTQCVSALLAKEDKQWNPVTKKLAPWIDMRKLEQKYKPKRRWFGK